MQTHLHVSKPVGFDAETLCCLGII